MSQDEFVRLRTQSPVAVFWRKVRVALSPRSGKLTAILRNGVSITGRNKAGWGGRGVYIFREDIEPELQLLPRILRKGSVFIDVGASVGVYSLSAAALVGSQGVIVSVEPFPDTYAQLCENVSKNRFGEIIRARNFCLSDSIGPVTLWMNSGRPNSFSLQRLDEAPGHSALSLTLDQLVAWERLESVDYLKIDAEGAEKAILHGGRETIRRLRPVIQLEDLDRSICKSLENYSAFGVVGTRNVVLIPEERRETLGGLLDGDWVPLR